MINFLPVINNSDGVLTASQRGPAAIESDYAQRLMAFLEEKSGATAIEYWVIAAGIALAILPVITGVGSHLKSTFQVISTALK